MKNRLALMLLILISFASAAFALELDEYQEKRAANLDTQLMAPCCWTQPVSEHGSSAAVEIHDNIRVMVAQGKSDDEILDSYIEKYGERILSAPRKTGFGLLAYFLPFIGIIIAFIIITKKGMNSKMVETDSKPRANDEYNNRLDKELDNF